MVNPKISIITVVYNRVNTIEQLINSVITQSYPNIEFIIIDGGSNDGTLDIIRKYNSRITKWISEPDTGIYNAMNKGVKLATGDYIEFIGSDDSLVNNDVIKKIVPLLNEKTDILSCTEYLVYPREKRQKIYSNDFARNRRKYNGGMVGHAAMFTRKEVLEKYPFDESYKIVADYKFFLQCYYDDNITMKFCDECVAYFEFEGEGISNNINDCLQENARVYDELRLPFDDKKRMRRGYPLILKCIVNFIESIGLKQKLGHYRRVFLFEKHSCNNPKCRWCKK